MQPYFFPYIGYFQMINAVDEYVIYDDVNFINRGWIHRNRILVDGQPKYINLPMFGASQNKLIKDIAVNNDEKEIIRNLSIIYNAYKKAPYFKEVYPILQECLQCGKSNVAEYIGDSLDILCNYLGIETKLIYSSSINKDCTLKGETKILQICELRNATDYYNAIGGQTLYSSENFAKKGMNLYFLKTEELEYKQFENDFQANLSIIDVMMFNSKEEISSMLDKYVLIR